MTDLSRRRLLQSTAVALAAGAAPRAIAAEPEYGLARGLIHLNTASIGSTPRAVLDAVLRAWRALEADPVVMAYRKTGATVLVEAEQVRERAAAFLGCATDELLITRCTTDGMSTVAQSLRWRAGDRILTTDQEHHGGSLCWEYEARRRGAFVDTIAIAPEEHDAGAIVRRFADAMTSATRAISVSHVLSTTGLRMPIAEIAALAHAHGALCIVDGAQAAGAIAVDVKALRCDAYATSGHKWLLGPKGTGLLYVSRDASEAIAPIEWEDSKHFGAEAAGLGPLPLVIGLGVAIDRMRAIGMAEVERRNVALRERAWKGLSAIDALRVVGPPPGPLQTPIVAAIVPDAIDSADLIHALHDKHGVIVKMVEKRRFNGIRLSTHVYNDDAQLDAALKAIRAELS